MTKLTCQENTNINAVDTSIPIITGMGPVTDKMINDLINNCNNRIVRNLITNRLINPLTQIINKKTQPYIHFGIGLYVTVIILLCIIIYLLIAKR